MNAISAMQLRRNILCLWVIIVSLLASGCIVSQGVDNDVAIVDAKPLLPPASSRSIFESDWLRAQAGHTDSVSGVRVESVEPSADGNSVAVRVSLPESASEIEEVVVYGRTKDEAVRRAITQPARVETLNSPERNGVIIYLPNQEDFVLRINYFEPTPDVIPDRVGEQ